MALSGPSGDSTCGDLQVRNNQALGVDHGFGSHVLAVSSVGNVESGASASAVEQIRDPRVVVVSENPRESGTRQNSREFEVCFRVERMQVKTLTLNKVRRVCVDKNIGRNVVNRT